MSSNVASNSGGGRCGVPRQALIDKRLCISVPEAASMLGLSRNLVYELVKLSLLEDRNIIGLGV
jgi:hypothetical protein